LAKKKKKLKKQPTFKLGCRFSDNSKKKKKMIWADNSKKKKKKKKKNEIGPFKILRPKLKKAHG
jgi:hypothetical protein